MIRGKQGQPRADIGQYLPLLRAYVKEHYRQEAVRYPKGTESGLGLAEGRPEAQAGEGPVLPDGAWKGLSGIESPAVQRYYRSWEKKRSVTKTFSSEVTRRVEEQFARASAFYLPAGIDKRTYHKIKADYLYRPSRDTAVKCCLGLGLDDGESRELLQLAGYALSPSDPKDLVILFCLENGIRDLASVNCLLGSLDIKDLDGYMPE